MLYVSKIKKSLFILLSVLILFFSACSLNLSSRKKSFENSGNDNISSSSLFIRPNGGTAQLGENIDVYVIADSMNEDEGVFYTLDGSEPKAESKKYEVGPLVISNDTILRVSIINTKDNNKTKETQAAFIFSPDNSQEVLPENNEEYIPENNNEPPDTASYPDETPESPSAGSEDLQEGQDVLTIERLETQSTFLSIGASTKRTFKISNNSSMSVTLDDVQLSSSVPSYSFGRLDTSDLEDCHTIDAHGSCEIEATIMAYASKTNSLSQANNSLTFTVDAGDKTYIDQFTVVTRPLLSRSSITTTRKTPISFYLVNDNYGVTPVNIGISLISSEYSEYFTVSHNCNTADMKRYPSGPGRCTVTISLSSSAPDLGSASANSEGYFGRLLITYKDNLYGTGYRVEESFRIAK